MKKMFGIVIALLFLYIGIQALYSFIVGKQINLYTLKVDDVNCQVKEIYTTRHKTEGNDDVDKNNYYYEITTADNIVFPFKLIGNNYTGVKQFLTDIKIYKHNNVTCLYPIFKDKVPNLDVLCHDNDTYYLYGTVKGENTDLDAFITYLKGLGYYHLDWDEQNSTSKTVGSFNIYPSNIINTDRIFTIWQYHGFYRIFEGGEQKFSFDNKDVYEPHLITMVNQYYIVPDYKDEHQFNRIYVTNLISGSMETMNLEANISYDSFIQGVVDNKIYLVDRSNKLQYMIDIYNKKVEIVGNVNISGKYHNNGKWEEKSIYDIIDNNLVFKTDISLPATLQSYKPIAIGEVGGDTDGYYYFYMKEGNNVSVYRIDKQNTSILTLLFRIPSVSNIKYAEGDIFFISGDTLYAYRDELGLKPLAKYNEFIFNRSNLYNVFVNK